jgi:microcystin-dependent protein
VVAALDFPANPADGQAFTAPTGVLYVYNAAYQAWLAQGLTMAPMPSGTVVDFAGAFAPNGWYLCDGSLKDRVADADLFAAIGETYGAGDGSTTFAVPDLRGRVTAMLDGGTGRLNGAEPGGMGTQADALGGIGGEQSHVMTADEMTYHGHSIYDAGHAHGPPYSNAFLNANTGDGYWTNITGGPTAIYYSNQTQYNPTGISINPNGGSAPMNNVQPTMAMNKLIKR